MIPAKIMKKPAMFIPVPVGSVTRTEPRITSDADITISLTERTLMNVFSIIYYHLVKYIFIESSDEDVFSYLRTAQKAAFSFQENVALKYCA
jgi:hypothetical protein